VQSKSRKRRNVKDFGRTLDAAIRGAGRKVEQAGQQLRQRVKEEGWDQEAERLIDYLNDEVVPAVRSHSSHALKVAAKKLSDFADILDERG
jgi:hypothetical protein